MEAGPELSSGSLPDQSDATILTAKLTAMLRLANSMDRSHGQKLKDCRITVKDKTLTVSAEYSGDIKMCIRDSLCAGDDDGLFGVLDQVGHGGSSIGHGIGAVADHKAVVVIVIFLQHMA